MPSADEEEKAKAAEAIAAKEEEEAVRKAHYDLRPDVLAVPPLPTARRMRTSSGSRTRTSKRCTAARRATALGRSCKNDVRIILRPRDLDSGAR